MPAFEPIPERLRERLHEVAGDEPAGSMVRLPGWDSRDDELEALGMLEVVSRYLSGGGLARVTSRGASYEADLAAWGGGARPKARRPGVAGLAGEGAGRREGAPRVPARLAPEPRERCLCHRRGRRGLSAHARSRRLAQQQVDEKRARHRNARADIKQEEKAQHIPHTSPQTNNPTAQSSPARNAHPKGAPAMPSITRRSFLVAVLAAGGPRRFRGF